MKILYGTKKWNWTLSDISKILPSRRNSSLRHKNRKWPMKWLNSREVTNELTGFLYLWCGDRIRRQGRIFDIMGSYYVFTRKNLYQIWQSIYSKNILIFLKNIIGGAREIKLDRWRFRKNWIRSVAFLKNWIGSVALSEKLDRIDFSDQIQSNCADPCYK
jgi:hypothetical protein